MTPLYETTLPNRSADPVAIHALVESLLKQDGVASRRDYLWSLDPDRRLRLRWWRNDVLQNWVPLQVPEQDARVRGLLHADASRWKTVPARPNVKHSKRRQPIQGEMANLLWLDEQLDKAGLEMLHGEYRQEPIRIAFRHKADPRYRTGQFRFAARVHDPQRLHAALQTGIGNAKAYGLGMLRITNLDGLT